MKKPFNNAYAFTALLVFAAITPQSVWASKCKVIDGRMPASDEQITCLKEEKDRLEKDMKKLVEDKEKIVKELEELKSSKKESSSDKKVIAKEEEKHDQDVADMMGYFTYMLLNQQQQQEAMMNQMFSYMTQSMQNFVYSQSMQNNFGQQYYTGWKNPYSFQSFAEMGNPYTSMNPLTTQGLGLGLGFGSGIGISYSGDSFYQNPYAQNQQQDFVKTPYRYPASQPSQMGLMPNQMERSQIITPPRVDGYDFNKEVPVQSQQQPKMPQSTERKPPLDA